MRTDTRSSPKASGPISCRRASAPTRRARSPSEITSASCATTGSASASTRVPRAWVCPARPRRNVRRDPRRGRRIAPSRGSTTWRSTRIERAAVYPTYGLMIQGVTEREPALALCRAVNDWLADYCRAAPDHLLGIGTLPMTDPADALAEARRCVEQLGMRGVWRRPEYFPGIARLHDPGHEALFAYLAGAGIPLAIHPGLNGVVPCGFYEQRFEADYAAMHAAHFPVEQLMSLTEVIAFGILERHPRPARRVPRERRDLGARAPAPSRRARRNLRLPARRAALAPLGILPAPVLRRGRGSRARDSMRCCASTPNRSCSPRTTRTATARSPARRRSYSRLLRSTPRRAGASCAATPSVSTERDSSDRRRGHAEAVGERGAAGAPLAEDRAQDLRTRLRAAGPPAAALHDQHRHGDARAVGGRGGDEPFVAAGWVLAREAAGLRRHRNGREQRARVAPEGGARGAAHGGLDHHVPQLAGDGRFEHAAHGAPRRQRELPPARRRSRARSSGLRAACRRRARRRAARRAGR